VTDDAVVRVLVAFPPDPAAEHLERLRALSPRVEVVACTYMESPEARSARGRGHDAEVSPAALPADFRAALANAEVVLTLGLPPDVRELAPGLRWVQAIGAGVDHYRGLGLEGLLVTNAVGVSAVPMAEFVIGRILQVWKRFGELAVRQREHRWDAVYGRTLAGCTLAVVGVGAIGTAVAERAQAMGMRVLGIRRSYTPGATHPACDELFGPDALTAVVARSDAVVLSAPATAETQDLFDADVFAAMRPGAVFCNVARGSMVDEGALVDALTSGHLGAAILDVTREEPLPADSALWDTPGMLLSPHSSTSPEHYYDSVFDIFADNLGRYLRGEPLRNVVDLRAGY